MLSTTEIEIATFVGAIIGALIGLLAPFYNKKKELGWNDIDIIFDKAFLKATVVSIILAVIGVGGSFPILLENVPPTASILTTVITSAVLAMTLHLGGNLIIGPSKITHDAVNTLLEKNTMRFIENKVSRISSTIATSGTPNFGQDCTCQKCKDNKAVEEGLDDDDDIITS